MKGLPSFVNMVLEELSISDCDIIEHEERANDVHYIEFKGYFKVPYNSVILRKHKVDVVGLGDSINVTIRMM